MPCRAPRDDGLFRCSVMLAGSDTEWGKPTQVLLLRTSAPLQRRKPRCRIHCGVPGASHGASVALQLSNHACAFVDVVGLKPVTTGDPGQSYC